MKYIIKSFGITILILYFLFSSSCEHSFDYELVFFVKKPGSEFIKQERKENFNKSYQMLNNLMDSLNITTSIASPRIVYYQDSLNGDALRLDRSFELIKDSLKAKNTIRVFVDFRHNAGDAGYDPGIDRIYMVHTDMYNPVVLLHEFFHKLQHTELIHVEKDNLMGQDPSCKLARNTFCTNIMATYHVPYGFLMTQFQVDLAHTDTTFRCDTAVKYPVSLVNDGIMDKITCCDSFIPIETLEAFQTFDPNASLAMLEEYNEISKVLTISRFCLNTLSLADSTNVISGLAAWRQIANRPAGPQISWTGNSSAPDYFPQQMNEFLYTLHAQKHFLGKSEKWKQQFKEEAGFLTKGLNISPEFISNIRYRKWRYTIIREKNKISDFINARENSIVVPIDTFPIEVLL